jgi:hypothetical protein
VVARSDRQRYKEKNVKGGGGERKFICAGGAEKDKRGGARVRGRCSPREKRASLVLVLVPVLVLVLVLVLVPVPVLVLVLVLRTKACGGGGGCDGTG